MLSRLEGFYTSSNLTEFSSGRIANVVEFQDKQLIDGVCPLFNYAERTKQMEPILRAKVEIFFKSENFKKRF